MLKFGKLEIKQKCASKVNIVTFAGGSQGGHSEEGGQSRDQRYSTHQATAGETTPAALLPNRVTSKIKTLCFIYALK